MTQITATFNHANNAWAPSKDITRLLVYLLYSQKSPPKVINFKDLLCRSFEREEVEILTFHGAFGKGADNSSWSSVPAFRTLEPQLPR